MKRIWKLTGTVLGLIVLALITTVVAITLLLDPNQFKPLIISQFKNFTGFEMTIPGKLSWSFYPHFGVEAEEVTVSDPAVFNSRIRNLTLKLKLRPLLHKQIELEKVSINNLQFNQLEATKLSSRIRLKDQILQIKSLDANFYHGKLKSDTTISLKQTPYPMHIKGNAKEIAIADFLHALSQKEQPKVYLDGLANVAADLTTQGKTKNELLSQLNGTVSFNLDKGALKGIDVGYYVETAAALINKQPLPTRAPKNQTDFNLLSGTAVVKNGVIRNDDMTLDALQYTVKAKGSINLVNRTIDYHLDIVAKPGQTDKVLALYGKTIPVNVSGSLDNPKVTLDTLALMEQIGKEQLQKVQEKIEKALPEKANKLIQNLLH